MVPEWLIVSCTIPNGGDGQTNYGFSAAQFDASQQVTHHVGDPNSRSH